MNNQNENVLNRINQIIRDAQRAYESGNQIDKPTLLLTLNNIRRLNIATRISDLEFEELKAKIEDLIQKANNNATTNSVAFAIETSSTLCKGRPKLLITKEQLQILFNEGYTASAMAKHFNCSKSTIQKRMLNFDLYVRNRYTNISDDELENCISEIHQRHPNCGQHMMMGYLKAQKIYVQRSRIRSILSKVDPVGTCSRWCNAIQRRTYSVPTPNSLWHMDAHLKLSRWGYVIHGCIDGYSRMIVYLSCTVSIQAEPVLKLFTKAVVQHGMPSRVRSDHGYENILVALLMNTIHGVSRGSHITGKSTHNQRIERLWLDVYKEVCNKVHHDLYKLEDDGLLDIRNMSHKFIVQTVYLPAINQMLLEFKTGWNHHSLRTERNRSPRQLWLDGLLQNCNSNHTAVNNILSEQNLFNMVVASLEVHGVSNVIPEIEIVENNVSSFAAMYEITLEQSTEINNICNSDRLTDREKYIQCVNCLVLP